MLLSENVLIEKRILSLHSLLHKQNPQVYHIIKWRWKIVLFNYSLYVFPITCILIMISFVNLLGVFQVSLWSLSNLLYVSANRLLC